MNVVYRNKLEISADATRLFVRDSLSLNERGDNKNQPIALTRACRELRKNTIFF